MKNKFIQLKKFNWSLFVALCALALIPAIYQTVKTFIITSNSSGGMFDIIGQMEWFDLINETLQAFLIIPLYSILNKIYKNSEKDFSKYAFKTGFITFIVYTLGFTFYKDTNAKEWKAAPHKESFMKLFKKLKQLVKRSWSIDLTYRINKINEVLRGWINYYRQSSMKLKLTKTGSWLRNAIRVIIWKQWKVPSKQISSLVKLGIDEEQAKGLTYCRKGYQFIAHSCIIQRSITNLRLKKRGLLNPLEYYLKVVA